MIKCPKCNTRIVRHLWMVGEDIYCSPKCERAVFDSKAQRWTTKNHRYGDKAVENLGIAGLKKKQ